MEWQPIETAPKDGTWVLLFENKKWWADVAEDKELDPPTIIARWVYNEYRKSGEWREAGSEPWGVKNASHWMPLPAPPKEG